MDKKIYTLLPLFSLPIPPILFAKIAAAFLQVPRAAVLMDSTITLTPFTVTPFTVTPSRSMNPEAFLEEADLMKKLKHKNILSLLAIQTKQEPVMIGI